MLGLSARSPPAGQGCTDVPVAGKRRQCRLPNPRLVKVHRSYTVEEVARLFCVHKQTVRNWLKAGLPALTDQRPLLILGRTLAAFLSERRQANKRPCGTGEIYCVRCRVPRKPAGMMAEYQPLNPTGGRLVGICPQCEALIYRRVSLCNLARDAGDLEVQITKGREHIDETHQPSVNCHFQKE